MRPSSSSLIKPLAILIVTLLIGMLLGATLTGALIRHRLSGLAALTQEESFAARMIDLIEPASDEQLNQIAPILLRAGGEIEAAIESTQENYCTIIENMTEDLTPYLSPEQLQTLEDRRNRFRNRFSRLPNSTSGDNASCRPGKQVENVPAEHG